MAENDGKTIHSVAKAITLLDILTAKGRPAALTDLYRETGWPKSTIHGLLSTMRASGLIEQGPDGRYWRRRATQVCALSPRSARAFRHTARRRESCFLPRCHRPSAAASCVRRS